MNSLDLMFLNYISVYLYNIIPKKRQPFCVCIRIRSETRILWNLRNLHFRY
jgi:hypothetical protein